MMRESFIRRRGALISTLFMMGFCVLFCGLLSGGGVAQEVTNRWTGGSNNDWFDGANWSESSVPGAGQAVVIDTSYVTSYTNVLLTSSTPWLASFVISNRMLTFSNWTTALQATNVTIAGNGVLTLPGPFTSGQMSNRISIVCSNLFLQVGGALDVRTNGFARASGPGAGTNGYPASGAAHGGQGGFSSSANGGLTYDDATTPESPGSGGGNYDATRFGGDGGGVVRVIASGRVDLQGTIRADGGNGMQNSGGGAGGTVWITCYDFAGSSNGLVSANGGDGSNNGGGGGGGRIALAYTLVAPGGSSVRSRARPGTGFMSRLSDDRAAQPGTLFLSSTNLLDESLGALQGVTLTIPGFSSWSPTQLDVSNTNTFVRFPDAFQLSVANDVLVRGGLLLFGTGSVVTVMNSMILTNGGRVYLWGGSTNSSGQSYNTLLDVSNVLAIASNSWMYTIAHRNNGGAPLIRCRTLAIDRGGGVDADGSGFLRDYGPGKGLVGQRGAGGGHGGIGGDSTDADGGNTNDAVDAPILPGSGGGTPNASWGGDRGAGGNGGGVIRLEVVEQVTLNGSLLARGDPGRYRSGGGAGGSIYVACRDLSGSTNGVLNANGGQGEYGGGGGGRIALVYTNITGGGAPVRFSTRPGYGVYTSLLDDRSPQMGTLYLPDTNLLSGVPDAFCGVNVAIPGFTNWGLSNLTLRTTNAILGFAERLCINVSNDVLLDSGQLLLGKGSELKIGGAMVLTNGGAFYAFGDVTNGAVDYSTLVDVTGVLRIGSNSWLYLAAHPTNGGAPKVHAASVQVASGGGFNADGGGFLRDKGPGKGVQESGGGHGGHGGNGRYGAGGVACGASNAPIAPGSGGATGSGGWGGSRAYGGSGGGTVRLDVDGTLTVAGRITANGLDGIYNSGGGAGGGIFVTCAQFDGVTNATVTANGGNGAGEGGGGGGGRIAVWVNVPQEKREKHIAGLPVANIAISNGCLRFGGALSVTNGLGYTNFPPGGAESGTCLFFVYTGGMGTVFAVR